MRKMLLPSGRFVAVVEPYNKEGAEVKCKDCRNDAEPGRIRCESCLEKRRVAERKRSKRNKAGLQDLKTISIEELVDAEKLDVCKIIREGIKNIPAGQVVMDQNFRRELGVAEHKWKEFATDSEFEDNRCTLPTRKRVWGNAEDILEICSFDGVTKG